LRGKWHKKDADAPREAQNIIYLSIYYALLEGLAMTLARQNALYGKAARGW